MRVRLSIFFFLFISACSVSKNITKPDTTTIENLKRHIQYLASDELEGRRTGTNGERLAMEYIKEEFRKEGLSPKGEDDYYQSFEVNDGKEVGPETNFIIK